MITNFFKRKVSDDSPAPDCDSVVVNDTNNNKSAEIDDTGPLAKTKRITASVKTVKKWEQEFNVPIGLVKDGDIVTTIWCETCEKFAVDRSSAVSNFASKAANFIS